MSDATARGQQADTKTGTNKPGLRVSSSSNTPRELKSSSRRKLTRLLLTKAAVEAMLVFCLAFSFFYYTFASRVRGTVDDAHADNSVTGWAIDDAEPAAPVEVHLYIDGHFASGRLADESRPELAFSESGVDERHGFAFQLPAQIVGEHEAAVYALRAGIGDARRTLHIIGHPIRLSVHPSATMTGNAIGLSREGAAKH